MRLVIKELMGIHSLSYNKLIFNSFCTKSIIFLQQ
jgi:hypothetical protein